MSAETVKIRCNMSLHYAINTDYDEVIDTGIPRSEWAEMSAEEREKVCEEIYEEFVWAQIDGGWDVADGGEG
ncbi:DUF7167 family protein [Planobispora rosea]|uniref:DUF7167 family protein n=1 Tax=Planobispora rosea TaxID=35762 RepID=UPI00083B5828|nr:hypothetical protein [Planobispora rosea]